MKTTVSDTDMQISHVNDLTDLKRFPNDELNDVFMSHIEFIYQYGLQDIQSCIIERPLDTLEDLRKRLFLKLQQSFPQYSNMTMMNRKKQHTFCSDIAHLGYSVVNDNPSKELDKICIPFAPDNEVGATSVSSLDDDNQEMNLSGLIALVTGLQKRVKTLEKELAQLKEKAGPASQVKGSVVTQQAKEDGKVATQQTSSNTETTAVNKPTSSVREVTTNPSHSDSSSDDLDDESEPEMTMVTSKKKKRRKRRSESTNALLQPNALKAAEVKAVEVKAAEVKPTDVAVVDHSQKKDIYIGGVHPSNTSNDIMQHLQMHKVKLTRDDIRPLNKGDIQHSFCVSLAPSAYNRVLVTGNDSLWPKGLKVRPFRPRKSQKQELRVAAPKPRQQRRPRNDFFRQQGSQQGTSYPARYPARHHHHDMYIDNAHNNVWNSDCNATYHNDSFYEYRYDYDSWPRLARHSDADWNSWSERWTH